MPSCRTHHRLLSVLLLAALVVAACGPAGEPTPVPTPTRPLRPTFTPTPLPTDTPTPEPPTPTPVPTDTPTAVPTPTPEPPTPTPEAKPVAVVTGSAAVNVRSGPGTAYPLVGSVPRGTELEIVARNRAGDWWQVCCVNGQTVWIVARLVTARNADGVPEAANVPPPPAPRPVAPRPTPTPPPPAPPPAPAYAFAKADGPPPRTSTNPWVTFFGLLYTPDLKGAVGDHKLRVESPAGVFEGRCEPAVLFGGGPDESSKFIFNCKTEVPGAPTGSYRVYPVDMGGNQVGEAYTFNVQGEVREFFPRWRKQ